MATEAGTEAKQVTGALTSMSIDEMISKLAIGIAKGQGKLDEECMEIARFMGEAQIDFGKKPGSNLPDQISLVELGFTPNFYQFVDTILEVKVAISSQFEETRENNTSYIDLKSQEHEDHQSYERTNVNSGYSRRSSNNRWSFGRWRSPGSSSYSASSYYNRANQKSDSSNKSKALQVATVDAKYAATYNYSVEAASSIKTKIVPVPPPDVFEEIIRGKLQERREWEALMNRQFEIGSIIPELKTKVNLILLQEMDGFKGLNDAVVGDMNQEFVQEIQNRLDVLVEKYANITTDHWSALKGSVALREQCDTYLNTSRTKTQTWLAKLAEGPITGAVDDFKKPIIEALNKFTEKLDAVKDLLDPEVIGALEQEANTETETES